MLQWYNKDKGDLMKMCIMCLERLAEDYSDYCEECQEILKEEIHKEAQ